VNTYVLRRKERTGYDEAAGFVVVAESAAQARRLAAAGAGVPGYPRSVDWVSERVGPGDEQAGTWLDPQHSTCQQVSTAAPGVVLRDFRAA
jgi:hypothetical protein